MHVEGCNRKLSQLKLKMLSAMLTRDATNIASAVCTLLTASKYLTDSMETSLSRPAAAQEVPSTLRNQKLQNHISKSPTLTTIFSQINPILPSSTCFRCTSTIIRIFKIDVYVLRAPWGRDVVVFTNCYSNKRFLSELPNADEIKHITVCNRQWLQLLCAYWWLTEWLQPISSWWCFQ
jgi:hypothetical protein